MTRITKEMRADIVTKALASVFDARETALEASRAQLADEMYHLMFGSVEAAAKALPPGWIEEEDTLVLSAPNWTHLTRRYLHREEKWLEIYAPYNVLKLSKPRPMPVVSALREYKVDKGHTLYAHTRRIANEHRAILEGKDALSEKLNSLLRAVTTFKQLREAWPEGEQFFPSEAKITYAVVPATLTHEVNRMLGLEPKGAARKVVKKAMAKS